MRTFRREAAAYVAAVDPAERAVLVDVVDEVVALVAAQEVDVSDGGPIVLMDTAPVAPPEDPALRRLLPDASREDAEVAAEYRRLTEAELRVTKGEQLRRLRAALADADPDLVVVPSEAPAVAAALTDVRLVVSERLGIRDDADADALYDLVAAGPDDDDSETAERFLATVYVVLSLLQESLVGLMLAGLDDGLDDGLDGGGDDGHGDGAARARPGRRTD